MSEQNEKVKVMEGQNPELKLSNLIDRIEFLTRNFASRYEQNAERAENYKEIIKTSGALFYVLCGLMIIVTLIFALIAYKQKDQITQLSKQIEMQPVAKIDTGESKLAFEKIGDQVTAAAGNTILAVNRNTDEKLKAVQEEMQRQLSLILARQKQGVVIKKVYIKPKKHHQLEKVAKAEPKKAEPEPMMPFVQEKKAVLDVDKKTGRAYLK